MAFQAHRVKDRLLDLINIDTEAFNRIMAAMRLPKTGEREIIKIMAAMRLPKTGELEIKRS